MNTPALKKLVLAVVLLISGAYELGNRARAQTQTPTAQKAAETLGHARELYSNKGALVALPEYEKALALFRSEGDRKGEAITIGLIGNCYKRLGDFPKALDYLQRALAMKRELGDRLEEGKTLNNIGLLYWETSEYAKALETLKSALT